MEERRASSLSPFCHLHCGGGYMHSSLLLFHFFVLRLSQGEAVAKQQMEREGGGKSCFALWSSRESRPRGLRSVDRVSGFLFYHKFLSFFGSLFVSGKERGAKKRRKKRALSLFFTSRTYVRASSTAHRARQVITEEEKGISLEAYTTATLRMLAAFV